MDETTRKEGGQPGNQNAKVGSLIRGAIRRALADDEAKGRDTLNQIIGGKLKIEQGVTSGSIKLDSDAKKFEEFVSLLDTFDPWYQVMLPMGTK